MLAVVALGVFLSMAAVAGAWTPDHTWDDCDDACPEDDNRYGTSGKDLQQARGGEDEIWGASEADHIFLGPGDLDHGTGEGGPDEIRGENGNDFIDGRDGSDELWGAEQTDVIYGGDLDDTIWAGAQNDTLYGEAGDDELNGGDGEQDSCNGGSGADRYSGCESY